MVLTWARCRGLFLWQLPDRPDSLRIIQPKDKDIIRPTREELANSFVSQVFTALGYESPDFNTPVTPGSRYEGWVRQHGNRVAESASQTEEDEAAGESEESNCGKTMRDMLLREIYERQAKQDAAAATAAQTAGQTSAPPFKSAPAPPPPAVDTTPATLPHRTPPKPKGVTPVPSPMPVIHETGQDAQEEPASQDGQDAQEVPDHAGWSPGWQQQSNSGGWRSWNNWGWPKPRGVPWWYSICCVYMSDMIWLLKSVIIDDFKFNLNTLTISVYEIVAFNNFAAGCRASSTALPLSFAKPHTLW